MPKRKATADNDVVTEPLRRSTRQKSSATAVASAAGKQGETRGNDKSSLKQPLKEPVPKTTTRPEPPKKKKAQPSKDAQPAVEPEKRGNTDTVSSADNEKNYWLLKAEPETRLEKGVDVRFSIDDLAAKTEPEPWDGIRAYPARNNLRAMKKGDLAFFYHSNCKEPGIVGTMEIVQEHSPDLTAHNPKAPYYDPTSKEADPKWSVVHVEFRSKFAIPIGLKELRTLGTPGKPLESMQMLKQSRLSVSKVSAAEWQFLMKLADKKASEED